MRANAATIQAHLPRSSKLFAVVKANGYGHGAQRVAHAALNGGAWGLAVATLEEAEELTNLVKPDRVLVMGGLTSQQAARAAGRRLSQRLGESGLLASDLLLEIPVVMNVLRLGGL